MGERREEDAENVRVRTKEKKKEEYEEVLTEEEEK